MICFPTIFFVATAKLHGQEAATPNRSYRSCRHYGEALIQRWSLSFPSGAALLLYISCCLQVTLFKRTHTHTLSHTSLDVRLLLSGLTKVALCFRGHHSNCMKRFPRGWRYMTNTARYKCQLLLFLLFLSSHPSQALLSEWKKPPPRQTTPSGPHVPDGV